jgi:hypothetical protein
MDSVVERSRHRMPGILERVTTLPPGGIEI